MKIQASTPREFLDQVPGPHKEGIQKLRKSLKDNLPPGFQETIIYGMMGYVVPHQIYPKGYHVNPDLPLPFITIASQKNHIALYHSGLYADRELMDWFVEAYQNQTGSLPDMGKSCLRFKKMGDIPFGLMGQLASKMTPQQWIHLYESITKR